ncbi:hypothetical protein EYF80_048280 [Liparis tanakae]|uniref:Uncharacterized protein n=1 Tax=Liparis tanakae TaxID=230148 RepID=A0A4Z2FK09_9TELE|nr:hypothetical protein EYF80_048280 [Liparis tanakae]
MTSCQDVHEVASVMLAGSSWPVLSRTKLHRGGLTPDARYAGDLSDHNVDQPTTALKRPSDTSSVAGEEHEDAASLASDEDALSPPASLCEDVTFLYIIPTAGLSEATQ